MAVGFDAVGPTNGSRFVAASGSLTHVVGAGANRALLCAVSAVGTGNTITSVTLGAQTFTSFSRQTYLAGSILGFIEIFYLVNPTSGSGTVTVNMSGSTTVCFGTASFDGVDQTTPLASLSTATGNSSSASTSITPTASQYGIWCVGSGDTVSSVGNRTLIYLEAPGNNVNGAAMYAAGTGSALAGTWSISNDSWRILGAVIQDAAGAAAGTPANQYRMRSVA